MTARHPDPTWWTRETFEGVPLDHFLQKHDLGAIFRFLRSRGFSRHVIAAMAGLSETRIRAISHGTQRVTAYEVLTRVADGLHVPRELMGLSHHRQPPPSGPTTELDLAHQLLQAASTGVSQDMVTAWNDRVDQLGRATRSESPDVLADQLVSGTVQLAPLINDNRIPARHRLELRHNTARIAGLTALTLLKTGDRHRSEHWFATANQLTDESTSPQLQSWIDAQHAYAAFYHADIASALTLAERARARGTGVGAALAAALLARAHAAVGDHRGALSALDAAIELTDRLDPTEAIRSAFGYDHAQLAFHRGNALTALGLHTMARQEHQRALTLYPADDYLDRTLIELDHAESLIHSGEPTHALHTVTAVIRSLTTQRSAGLITDRFGRVLYLVPAAARSHAAYREASQLLRERTTAGARQ
ncbi:hypothetical protein [Catellatospora sichuanensis]|uniref:hypothetical protein n=1 Tax=Catellatospora sichuanensis TaxID=1969805 RepID=UPI0011835FEF|nr:hypothetical protein [Catellatospora sichuanensis]